MATDSKIDQRDDVRPTKGEHKYGDVSGPVLWFADRTKNTRSIRLSTFGQPRVTAPATRINHKANAAKYDADKVDVIKDRIKKVSKKHDVSIEDE